MGKIKRNTFIKSNISLLKLNWQKSYNINDKIKSNVHFENTFKVNEQQR